MARKTLTSDPSPESPALIHAQIPVIVHKADEGGYWAEVPALPGCFTQAETMEELKKNVQVAVDLYLEDNTIPPVSEMPDSLAGRPQAI